MAFYGDVSEIVELAANNNITADDITVAMQNVINSWIDENIYPDGFGVVLSADEYYDIENDNQTELMLEHFPVVSFTQLVDNVHATTPIIVNSDYYVVDNAAGIIQLITAYKTVTGGITDVINSFTKGFNNVRVQYTYGYASVPDDIKQLANQIAVNWASLNENQSGITGLKSVQIGDYKETYGGSGDVGVIVKNNTFLWIFYKRLKSKYSKGY